MNEIAKNNLSVLIFVIIVNTLIPIIYGLKIGLIFSIGFLIGFMVDNLIRGPQPKEKTRRKK